MNRLPAPVVLRRDGIELAIKVTPRASRLAVDGIITDAAGAVWLVVKVTAPPADGRANAQVLGLVADRLDVPASACRLVAGAGSRWKRVRVEGDPERLQRTAATLAGASPGG